MQHWCSRLLRGSIQATGWSCWTEHAQPTTAATVCNPTSAWNYHVYISPLCSYLSSNRPITKKLLFSMLYEIVIITYFMWFNRSSSKWKYIFPLHFKTSTSLLLKSACQIFNFLLTINLKRSKYVTDSKTCRLEKLQHRKF